MHLVARHLDAVDLHRHVVRRGRLHPLEIERAADENAGDLRERRGQLGRRVGRVIRGIRRARHPAGLRHVVQRDLVVIQVSGIPGVRERDAHDRHLDPHRHDLGDRRGTARVIVAVRIAPAEQRIAARASRLSVGREQDVLLLVAGQRRQVLRRLAQRGRDRRPVPQAEVVGRVLNDLDPVEVRP